MKRGRSHASFVLRQRWALMTDGALTKALGISSTSSLPLHFARFVNCGGGRWVVEVEVRIRGGRCRVRFSMRT
jgi:hypothetical protein